MTLTNLSYGHPLGNNDVKAWGNPGVAGRISDGWMLLGSSHTFSGGLKLYSLRIIGSSYGGVWPCFCCEVRNWISKPPVTWDPMILRVQWVDTLVETLVRIWKTWGWRREHVIYKNTKSPRFGVSKVSQTRLKDLEIVGSCETTELCFLGNQMLRHTIFRSKATSQGNLFSLSQRLSKIKQISKWLKTQSLCKPVILTTLAEN